MGDESVRQKEVLINGHDAMIQEIYLYITDKNKKLSIKLILFNFSCRKAQSVNQ